MKTKIRVDIELEDSILEHYDHLARDDSGGLSAFRRAEPQTFPKVLFRADSGRVKLHMGNHGVDHPGTEGQGAQVVRIVFK